MFKDEKSDGIIDAVVRDSDSVSEDTIPVSVPEGLIFSIFEDDYVTVTYSTENSYTVSETRIVKSYDYINNIITVKEGFSIIPPIASQVSVFRGKLTLVRESELIYNQTLKYEFNDILSDSSYTVKLEVTAQNKSWGILPIRPQYFLRLERYPLKIGASIRSLLSFSIMRCIRL